MSSRSEAALRSDVNRQSNQLQQVNRDIASVERMIERLRAADRQMATEKSQIDSLRRAVRRQEGQKGTWKGQHERWHDHYLCNDFRSNYDTYYRKADDLHDAIIRKIAELRAQSRDLNTLGGRLMAGIDRLWGEIRSLFN
jgi:small-conductance mechanosensitive channel